MAKDGVLSIKHSEPGVDTRLGEFAVMFAPTDFAGGAMKPHYCRDPDTTKAFLKELGLMDHAIDEIVAKLDSTKAASVRLSLPEEKIALI